MAKSNLCSSSTIVAVLSLIVLNSPKILGKELRFGLSGYLPRNQQNTMEQSEKELHQMIDGFDPWRPSHVKYYSSPERTKYGLYRTRPTVGEYDADDNSIPKHHHSRRRFKEDSENDVSSRRPYGASHWGKEVNKDHTYALGDEYEAILNRAHLMPNHFPRNGYVKRQVNEAEARDGVLSEKGDKIGAFRIPLPNKPNVNLGGDPDYAGRYEGSNSLNLDTIIGKYPNPLKVIETTTLSKSTLKTPAATTKRPHPDPLDKKCEEGKFTKLKQEKMLPDYYQASYDMESAKKRGIAIPYDRDFRLPPEGSISGPSSYLQDSRLDYQPVNQGMQQRPFQGYGGFQQHPNGWSSNQHSYGPYYSQFPSSVNQYPPAYGSDYSYYPNTFSPMEIGSQFRPHLPRPSTFYNPGGIYSGNRFQPPARFQGKRHRIMFHNGELSIIADGGDYTRDDVTQF